MSGERIHVAVGIIRRADRRILIARRPDHAHQGGLWEFPGGKVEIGETVQQALVRELAEELNIRADAFSPCIEVHHDYGDKSVFLDVWWVEAFDREPVGAEGQPLRWIAAGELDQYEFPAANLPITEAIRAQNGQAG